MHYKAADPDVRKAMSQLAKSEYAYTGFITYLMKERDSLQSQYERAKEALVLTGDNRPAALQLRGQLMQLTAVIQFLTDARTI